MHNWIETAEIVSAIVGVLALLISLIQLYTSSERVRKIAVLAMLGVVFIVAVIYIQTASKNQQLTIAAYDGNVRPSVLTDEASSAPRSLAVPTHEPQASAPEGATHRSEQIPAAANLSVGSQPTPVSTPPVLNYPPTFAEIEVVPPVPKVGEPVDFIVHPQGGAGYYSYDWTGSTIRGDRIDNRETWTAHVPKPRVIYKTPGRKIVQLTVYSYGTPFIVLAPINVVK